MRLSKPIFLLGLVLLALEQAYGWNYDSPTATGDRGTWMKREAPAISPSPSSSIVMPSDTSTHVDIIFTQRFGEVKYYDAAAVNLTLIKKTRNR